MYLKVLKQLGIILALCLMAEAAVSLLPFAFPSSVMAILLLAVLLCSGILKEEMIKETADFMLASMALVFVPLAVGIAEDLETLKEHIFGFVLALFLSLIITFVGTYASVRLVQICIIKRKEKGGQTDA